MLELINGLKIGLAALGTVAALGAFVGGVGYGLRALTGRNGKTGGAFSKAAEHTYQESVLERLGEIRDAVRDHNIEARHRHEMLELRIEKLDGG